MSASAVVSTGFAAELTVEDLVPLKKGLGEWVQNLAGQTDKAERIANMVFNIQGSQKIEPIIRMRPVDQNGEAWTMKEIVAVKGFNQEISLSKTQIMNFESHLFSKLDQWVTNSAGVQFLLIDFFAKAYDEQGNLLGNQDWTMRPR